MTDRNLSLRQGQVLALLEGRKTQHRLLLKPQPVACMSWSDMPEGKYPSAAGWSRIPARTGDRIYVREAWTLLTDRHGCAYRADTVTGAHRGLRWRPPLAMPRWASRLTLVVTDVRLQRLQDISEADAIAEGVIRLSDTEPARGWVNYITGDLYRGLPSARDSFKSLWNSLNDARGFGWATNPWVCALTFDVHRRNIDEMEDRS